MVLTIILGGLALLNLALTLWQWAVAIRFPLHQRAPHRAYAPPVTLLKPLKGLDSQTADCLRGWLTQEYPGEVEILFGVASAGDPVCELARELIGGHPKANAQLVMCPENLGANAKVSTLIQLMRRARHDLIIISDADVWATRDLLAQLVARFDEPAIGLVNCFYRMTTGLDTQGALKVDPEANVIAERSFRHTPFSRSGLLSTLGMRWEAFAVNADFWSQVLQSQSLKPLDFALGAVMATTRAQLTQIGGFASLADYLADDYQLGHRIAQNGGRIMISPLVVECRTPPMTWREVWTHQIRWARTIRACQPWPYFASQLHNATLWPWLWALWQPALPVFVIAGSTLLTRMVAGFYCEQKLTRRANFHALWLAPIKDLLQSIIWALAFFGNRINWRGQRFTVALGGKLIKSDPSDVSDPSDNAHR